MEALDGGSFDPFPDADEFADPLAAIVPASRESVGVPETQHPPGQALAIEQESDFLLTPSSPSVFDYPTDETAAAPTFDPHGSDVPAGEVERDYDSIAANWPDDAAQAAVAHAWPFPPDSPDRAIGSTLVESTAPAAPAAAPRARTRGRTPAEKPSISPGIFGEANQAAAFRGATGEGNPDRSEPATPPAPPPVTDPPAATATHDGSALPRSWVRNLLAILKREPVLFVSLAYLVISALGVWSSYWFYRAFNFPILAYMQTSDFFVAGLRRPTYLLWLAYAVVVAWASAWPARYQERFPERAAQHRARHWWGSMVFPPANSWMYAFGARSESLVVGGFTVLVLCLLFDSAGNEAADVRDNRSKAPVEVVMGSGTVLQGPTALLGTSGAFVFVWRNGAVEALPIDGVERIRSVPTIEPASPGDCGTLTPASETTPIEPALLPDTGRDSVLAAASLSPTQAQSPAPPAPTPAALPEPLEE